MTNNKPIIVALVFICCALMTSLFIYHTTHKQTLRIVADGNATLFPVARDIKPFTLVSTENKKFTQHDLIDHWSIVFFGFTHCATICPATLDMLGHAYTKLHTTYPKLQIILITLDPARDSLNNLSRFTHSFNPAFIGLSGKVQEIRKLQSQLGIFSARDDASPNTNYQIQHSSALLLINPHGQWAGVFKPGLNANQFISSFETSIKKYV